MSNIKYTGNLNGEGGWLTGIEGDPVAVDAAPGAEGWEPVNLTIDANENGDIEVEYTKPAAEISLPEVNITSSTNAAVSIYNNLGTFLYKSSGVITTYHTASYEKMYGVPTYNDKNDTYKIGIGVSSLSDNLNVNINDTPLSFDNTGYHYIYDSATYPDGFTIVITNKE